MAFDIRCEATDQQSVRPGDLDWKTLFKKVADAQNVLAWVTWGHGCCVIVFITGMCGGIRY